MNWKFCIPGTSLLLSACSAGVSAQRSAAGEEDCAPYAARAGAAVAATSDSASAVAAAHTASASEMHHYHRCLAEQGARRRP